jgi:DNA modification methylase|tara:strand:+ start:152 stop:781 length:630 start_codon:yes stop_codon:yes gene_type:complete
MKNLYIENCLETLKRNLEYDYVVASPPDFNELKKDTEDSSWTYSDFLKTFAELLNPKGNFVSICISDRKSNGQVISKSSMVIEVFKSLGYILHTHKIWVKSTGTDMFRMNYQHLLTFSRNKEKRKLISDFLPDVFVINQSKWNNYSYGMPVRIIELLVKNYTNKDSIVYDPFMGSGTTAEACFNTNRQCIGSEINEDYAKESLDRMKSL